MEKSASRVLFLGERLAKGVSTSLALVVIENMSIKLFAHSSASNTTSGSAK